MEANVFETTVQFEPVSLKRHRHRLKGGTYDPSKKDKDEFIKTIGQAIPEPENKMSNPIKCKLEFYCKRPKNHYKTGKKSNELKENAPKYNTNNKDLDNMVKFVLDALNDKLYLDDCLIVEITCKKAYSEGDGYIYMKFEEIV
jgi:Holliday junction resolvase RusA-like endonuclease